MKIKNIIRIILLMSLTLFLCSCRNNNGGLIRIKWFKQNFRKNTKCYPKTHRNRSNKRRYFNWNFQ